VTAVNCGINDAKIVSNDINHLSKLIFGCFSIKLDIPLMEYGAD